MKTVVLIRSYKSDRTEGLLVLPNGESIKTLERPWLNNQRNISCYPEGVYHCKWIERSASGKYKRIWHVTNVPKRTGILFHCANFVRQLQGCTATGMKFGVLGGVHAILQSLKGLNKMRQCLSGQDFLLVVVGND